MGTDGRLAIPPLNPCGSWKLVSWKVSGQAQGLRESQCPLVAPSVLPAGPCCLFLHFFALIGAMLFSLQSPTFI